MNIKTIREIALKPCVMKRLLQHTFLMTVSMTGTVDTDMNFGNKYPNPPGTLNYRETGGSNQVEVQIRVDEPSQHPRPSTTVATVRDKQSNLNSAKIIITRSLSNTAICRGWQHRIK